MDDDECPELVIEDTKDSDEEYSSEGNDDKEDEKSNDGDGDDDDYVDDDNDNDDDDDDYVDDDNDDDDDNDSSNGKERQTAGKWVCRQEFAHTCKLN